MSDLYQELSTRYGFPESKYLPMILKSMVSPEQTRILLQLTAKSEEVADKLRIDQQVVDDHLQELFEKGLAFPTSKGWRLGHNIDSLHDLALSNTKYWDSYGGNEYAHLWLAFEKLEWYPEFVGVHAALEAPLMRVVPAWQAVKDNPDLLPEEDIREIYKKVESIALIPCPCRRKIYNRGCGSPDELCITLNRSAKYNLKRGVGRELTVEEAIELEETARKHDAITVVQNSPVSDMVICHCHRCCCLSFHATEQHGSIYDEYEKSRYVAMVDPEKCNACQKCIATCQYGAAEMKKYPEITKWKAHIDADKCVGCGNCFVKCPKEGAVSLKAVRPPGHIPQRELDVYADAKAKK
ncbi:4Fe-4S binding protein [Thermodesulfobacteriota bacterium]